MTRPDEQDTNSSPSASHRTPAYCWFAYLCLNRCPPTATETTSVSGRYKPALCPNAPNVSVTCNATSCGRSQDANIFRLKPTSSKSSRYIACSGDSPGLIPPCGTARSADHIAGPTLPGPDDYKLLFLRSGGSHRHQSPDYPKLNLIYE